MTDVLDPFSDDLRNITAANLPSRQPKALIYLEAQNLPATPKNKRRKNGLDPLSYTLRIDLKQTNKIDSLVQR